MAYITTFWDLHAHLDALPILYSGYWGEERHVQNLNHTLVQYGHEVSVATLGYTGYPTFEEDSGVGIHRISSSVQCAKWIFKDKQRSHTPPLPDPEARLVMRSISAQEQPDTVHTHNWLLHSYLRLKPLAKTALVVSLHDYSLACIKKRLIRNDHLCPGPTLHKCLRCAADHYGLARDTLLIIGNRLMGFAERAAVDMLLPVSDAVAADNHVADYGLPYRVISNFVPDDLSVTQHTVDEYVSRLPNGGFLLFVGNVSRDKGIYVLLHAYAQLDNIPPLVLIGRECGDTPHVLPSNVQWLGIWPYSTVIKAWRRCTLALVPSTWSEPLRMVVIEAMGKPLIVSLIGRLPEIVEHERSRLLVSPDAIIALRDAMGSLLTDPARRAQMGEAAHWRTGAFAVSTAVPMIEQVCTALVLSPKVGGRVALFY